MALTFQATAIKRVNRGPGTSDYTVFQCPGCSRRNKQSLYEARYKTPEMRIGFKCKGCGAIVEVILALSQQNVKFIVSPEEYAASRQAKPLVSA